MSDKPFGKIPPGAPGVPVPFTFKASDDELARLRNLIELSPIGPSTYENEKDDGSYGLSRSWLIKAKDAWLNSFDWHRVEARINSVPNFKIKVDGLDIHFVGLFSTRKDAVPILSMHGWPGSFLELLPVVELVKTRYTPDSLPFHLIVPSLPGYAFSDGPPLDRDFGLPEAAQLLDKFMNEMGFGEGYVAQGGDVGSMIAMLLSAKFERCKALHVTYLAPNPAELPEGTEDLTSKEQEHLDRAKQWRKTGMGYALEQTTRPATVGLALSTSPLALLAWIGEKFIEWSDEAPSLDTVLSIVTLYWLTQSYPRTIWSYRSIAKEGLQGLSTSKEKPLGYSLFHRELGIVPKAWATKVYPNLVEYFTHDKGGHFPGLENPDALLNDTEQFLNHVTSTFNGYK